MPTDYTPESIASAISYMRNDINRCPEFLCKGFPGRKDCTNTVPSPLEYGKILPQMMSWSSVAESTEKECSRTKLGNWDFDGNANIDFLVFHLFFFPELLKMGQSPFGRVGRAVEFGAHNGVSASNTRFYDNHLGWKSLLIEPTSCMSALKKNRPNATLVQAAVCQERKVITLPGSSMWCPNEKGEKEVETECYPLSQIFEKFNKGVTMIDFMSIDTEGMEFEAIKSIDFASIDIRVIVAEWRSSNGNERKDYLQQFGYKSVKDDELFWRPDLFTV